MKATVVDLTFNAKPWTKELIEGVLAQKTDFDYELLIVDSGSTDGTLDIIKHYAAQHPGKVRLHQIPNKEFGHGRTRNQAAELAKGEIVVYLTHDAVPMHERWLEGMTEPFDNPKVVCVYGLQVPRPDCCPIVKRDVISTFSTFGPKDKVSLQHKDDPQPDQAAKDRLRFFSDVNSAVRRDFILNTIPYQDLNYAEDQALGRDVIDGGYTKAYTPFGAVLHSHSYPLFKYFRRMYDEMLGLKKATGQTLDTSLARHILIIGKYSLDDWRFILRDRDYSLLAKLKWIIQTPFYHLARRVAVRLSTKRTLPGWAHAFLSLEARAKKKA